MGGPLAQAGAAAILLTPVLLAKAAYNPSTVNRLIAFQNKKFSSQDAMMSTAAVILNDAIKAMSNEDQAEIRNYVMQEGS